MYQALDVGLFAPLKAAFVQERDRYKREHHESASKKNFLKIFGGAVVHALTKENIKKAMAQAGTWPIDDSIVTARVLAPSLETSWRAAMPLQQPTPVRIVTRLLELDRDTPEPEDSPPATPTQQTAAQAAATRSHINANSSLNREPAGGTCASVPKTPRTALRATTMAHLVNDAPIASNMDPLRPVSSLNPAWNVPPELLAHMPTTEAECVMLHALQMAQEVIKRDRKTAVSSQATMVLQNTYVNRVKGQLAVAEAKQKGGRLKGRLLVDGMPHVLTNDAFMEQVIAHEAAREGEEEEKQSREQARALWQAAVRDWNLQDAARCTHNEKTTADHKQMVLEWQAERDQVKSGQQTFREKKPVCGPLEAATRKPLLKDYQNSSTDVTEDFTASLEAIGMENEEEDANDED